MRTLNDHNYSMIDATIIADSKNGHGDRITTFVVTFPRIVLAEFNTHRALSRNSASSRAIPFEKMLKNVKENPFIPIAWQKDHKGMQGREYFSTIEVKDLQYSYLRGRDAAVERAEVLSGLGVTKQIANRMLEPYMWHTAIVTATEWENFFALRFHPEAEIHIAKLAEIMLGEYNQSIPKLLSAGQWHIPFGDRLEIPEEFKTYEGNFDTLLKRMEMHKLKIATARCARVSYMTFDGQDDWNADIKLHDRLAEAGHWSPFEHCAQAGVSEWSGNFKGFYQYRKTFKDENKKDNRVIKK